jgi:hypothetical protein
MAEPMAHETGQPEIIDQLVPPRRITQRRRGDYAITRGRADGERFRARPAVNRASVSRSGSMIGTERRRRPLVSLVTKPPRPG